MESAARRGALRPGQSERAHAARHRLRVAYTPRTDPANMPQLEAARLLLGRGADPSSVERDGALTPLMVGIIGSSGRADVSPIARAPVCVLAAPRVANCRTVVCRSQIVMARPGNCQVISLLLEHGAEADAPGPDGATAFHFACEQVPQRCAPGLRPHAELIP